MPLLRFVSSRDGCWVLFGGLLHALALSPWVAQAWAPLTALMQTAGLVCLLWVLSRQTEAKLGAFAAWLYGTAWLIGGTGWTYVSLHRFGGLPAWLAGFSVLALSAFLSIYLAMVGGFWVKWRRNRVGVDACAWAGLWLLAELARAWIFTGFPWAASGYGLVDVSWRWLAPWLGVYGLGACWAGCVAAAVLAMPSKPVGRGFAVWIASAVVLLASLVVQPGAAAVQFTKPAGQALSVTLLQGNVPQDEKFVPELQVPMLMWHTQQLMLAKTDLVVAPETAIPLLPSQLPEGYWDALVSGFQTPGRHALVGVPLGSFEEGYTNSIAGLSAEASLSSGGFYRYDKHHLVPFGEFIPFGFHWFVQLMNMPLGDFARGPLVTPPFVVKGQRVAPTICYEDLYGEEIAARFVNPAQSPTILANVSNLGWFGEDVAIFQHRQIARMRSLEFQIPTIRATNTGATMIVDHDGAVVQALKTNTQSVLTGQVQGYEGVTPYAWWAGRWGLMPLFAFGLLVSIPFNRIRLLRR